MIKQSSGEDWKSTKVSLSTATPSKGGDPPTLEANHLRVRRTHIYNRGMRMKSKQQVTIPTIGFSMESYDMSLALNENLQMSMQRVEEQQVILQSTQFIQKFDATRPATIPSDGTEHKVNSILCGTNT